MEKRRKPWYRLRNIVFVLLAIFLIFTGWLGWEIWKVANAKPNVATNYREQFKRLSAQVAGLPADHDGSEAWTLLLEIAELTVAIEKEVRTDRYAADFVPAYEDDTGWPNFSRINHGGTIPSEIDRERRALAAMHERGVISKLESFILLPMGFRPVDSDVSMLEEALPDLKQMRTLAKVLTADMRLQADAGRLEMAIREFEFLLAIARTIAHQPVLVSCLVARSIETMALNEVQHMLREQTLTAEQIRTIGQVMARYPMPGFDLAAEGEKALLHDFVQRYFSDDGHGNGYMLPGAIDRVADGWPDFIENIMARFVLAGRAEFTAKHDEWTAAAVAESKKPRAQRWKDFDPDQFVDSLPRRQMILKLMLPAFGKVISSDDAFELKRRATRVMLALSEFHSLHGRYPESLEDLTPQPLHEVPLDPMNSKPFGYRLLAHDPHHRGYLLYSFGVDGQDDNGIEAPGNEKIRLDALMHDSRKGIDFVLNAPRKSE